MYGIIGTQVAVYGAWTLAENNRTLYRKMLLHFTVSRDGVLRRYRIHTLLTSIFSHRDLWHLFMNSFTLYFFGLETIGVLGTARFLQLYLGGGLLSSCCHVGLQGSQLGLGASGAVYAVLLNSILMFPSRQLLLYGIIPVPAWLLGMGIVGYDVYGQMQLKRGYASSTGHAAHLGGAAFGAAFYALRTGRMR